MIEVNIPNVQKLNLEILILDYNGTIAKDGKFKNSLIEPLKSLSSDLEIYVLTADTYGSVKEELSGLDLNIFTLKSDDHTKEKGDFVEFLGRDRVVAVGNGRNDALMLKSASLGIAVLEDEGLCSQTLQSSNLLCKNIDDALSLLLYPKRLIATLRA